MKVLWIIAFVFSAIALGACEEPINVTFCQLKNGPVAYNHRLIKVTGFVSHAFEDFTLFDPTCDESPKVWLEYGGTAKAGTMYCCGVTLSRSRPKRLVIDKIPIPLVVDKQFKRFDEAIQPPFHSGQHGAVIHATLIGRFFAGEEVPYPKGTFGIGYGHMGCCRLLAIEQVVSADTKYRPDLDYGFSIFPPRIKGLRCRYQTPSLEHQGAENVKWQREADAGEHEWSFNDPRRVATEALTKLAKTDSAALINLKLVREEQGQKIFIWATEGKAETYIIEISQPYVMSFYARNPQRVAWMAVAAYRLCNLSY